MTDADFERLYPKYSAVIQAIARKYGHTDDAMVEDLEQEGRICLWKLDLSKATSNPDSYIRNALRNRMIDLLRRESPAKHDSLDERLAFGGELERLPNGDLFLSSQPPTCPADLWRDQDEIDTPDLDDTGTA
jgi:RNA polymerase sigma factor (sigma-70 family)